MAGDEAVADRIVKDDGVGSTNLRSPTLAVKQVGSYLGYTAPAAT